MREDGPVTRGEGSVMSDDPTTGRNENGKSSESQPLLDIRNLEVGFRTEDGVVQAVRGVSFQVRPGEILAVVGESGSGKSVTQLGLLGLLPKRTARISGEVWFRTGGDSGTGRELLAMPESKLRKLRGKDIAMIFQDPMTALNPVHRIGKQIGEIIRLHDKSVSAETAEQRAVELLGLVGVSQPETRVRQYPHEFSGGMRQRVMIAMAIANDPDLLIADEPTTALDVTIQAQVLNLLQKAQAETGAATILITHDLGVVAEMAERVVVMYAGKIVETGPVGDLFARPRHPYTEGLLNSIPRLDLEEQELTAIPGNPPNMLHPPAGCAFAPRCALRQGRMRCVTETPELIELGRDRSTACHFHDELGADATDSDDPQEASR